jgi:hypothetical protein
MSYALSDYTESLLRVHIGKEDVESVVAAWGYGSGMGTDSGNGFSEDGASEWSGGFLMKLRDGRWCYVTGWCDYTGWGCQDGAEVTYYTERPELDTLHEGEPPTGWDLMPVDLNRWLSLETAHR